MKFFFILLLTSIIINAQAYLEIKFSLIDGATGSTTLYVGFDPKATDGLDKDIGEYELPPLPPAGAFDARFNLPNSFISVTKDFRNATAGFTGEFVHELQFQLSSGSPGLTLSWDLPTGVSMNMTDPFGGALFNYEYGSGPNQIIISNTNLNKIIITMKYNAVTSVFSDEMPENFELMQNYPNPFNGNTIIQYNIPNPGMVKLALYDTLGTPVQVLYEGQNSAGNHSLQMDAAKMGISSGVYFYVMEYLNNKGIKVKESKKLIYMK